MRKRYAWIVFDSERDRWTHPGRVVHQGRPDRVFKPEMLWVFDDSADDNWLYRLDINHQQQLAEPPVSVAEFSAGAGAEDYETFLNWYCVIEEPPGYFMREIHADNWLHIRHSRGDEDFPTLGPHSDICLEFAFPSRAVVLIGTAPVVSGTTKRKG